MLNTSLQAMGGNAQWPKAYATLSYHDIATDFSNQDIDTAIQYSEIDLYSAIKVLEDIVHPLHHFLISGKWRVVAHAHQQRQAAAPAAATPVAFTWNDSTTWNMQPIFDQCNALQQVTLKLSDHNALTKGDLTTNSVVGGAAIGVSYHCHCNNGSAGIAFFYRHKKLTNDVTPVIYDYTIKRHQNKYAWKVSDKESNAAPPIPSRLQ